MKAYTDINQSKKLAEILPSESADMGYIPSEEDNDGNTLYTADFKSEFIFDDDCCIPCWSLAALLNVIPYNVSFNKAVYRFKMVKFSNYWECYHENFGSVSTEIFKADNPVDACYEMILKLHEQKIL